MNNQHLDDTKWHNIFYPNSEDKYWYYILYPFIFIISVIYGIIMQIINFVGIRYSLELIMVLLVILIIVIIITTGVPIT